MRPPSGALVDVLRATLRDDAELHGLLVTGRAYAFHDVGPERPAQRSGERAAEQHQRRAAAYAVPPPAYSPEAFTKTFGA